MTLGHANYLTTRRAIRTYKASIGLLSCGCLILFDQSLSEYLIPISSRNNRIPTTMSPPPHPAHIRVFHSVSEKQQQAGAAQRRGQGQEEGDAGAQEKEHPDHRGIPTIPQLRETPRVAGRQDASRSLPDRGRRGGQVNYPHPERETPTKNKENGEHLFVSLPIDGQRGGNLDREG
jgi:hypothetical protein